MDTGSLPPDAAGPPTAKASRDPLSVLTVQNTTPSKPTAPLTVADPPAIERPATDTPTVAQTPPAIQPVLRVVRGEVPNRPYPLLEGRNFVGRSSPERPVDIDLTGQEAVERVWSSRQHALVTVSRGTVTVEDLNSLNGTFVNRARVYPGQPRVLQAGDVVQIGTVQLRLEV